MLWTRVVVVLAVAAALGLALVSGGSGGDPRTPAALPGQPAPFLGTAVAGEGGVTAAVDAYGDVVDLRPSPAGRALIDNPSDRQAAGSVSARTGIVPRLRLDGRSLPMWRADSVSQRYLPGTDVVRTVARFGSTAVVMSTTATDALALTIAVRGGAGAVAGVAIEPGLRDCAVARRPALVSVACGRPSGPRADAAGAGRSVALDVGAQAAAILAAAARDGRRWLTRARSLGPGAPAWARRMYRRSLLTLRALTDRRTGAVAAGARDGWAYVWPRDAATAALALAAAGYRAQARRVVDFLAGLRIDAAARFYGDGAPVPGRGPESDARGWIRVAAARLGLDPALPAVEGSTPDYQEGGRGSYLGNTLATFGGTPALHSSAGRHEAPAVYVRAAFGAGGVLVRRAGDPASGLDSAAAWAVRPFAIPALYPDARRTLLRLLPTATRYGITPGSGWTGGADPWTAPTAWTAWAFAALADAERREPDGAARARADRRLALRLLGDLRRAATPAGALPERVGARTGIPRSTTPLAWSGAFAILALRQLWPSQHNG